MSFFQQVGRAAIGWLELISARELGPGRFTADRSGFVSALIVFGIASCLGTAAHGVARGFPSYTDVFVGLMFDVILLLAVSAVAFATMRVLKPDRTALVLVVPTMWALAFLWLLYVPLSFFDRAIYNAILGMLFFMLYRCGRGGAGLGIGSSVAYAILSVLVLVTVPLSLYMVISPGQAGPI